VPAKLQIGRSLSRPVRILCDFDGTITLSDTTDLILKEHAPEWEYYEEQWLRGEITARECMFEQTLCLDNVGLDGINKCLSFVAIDPHFSRFVQYCHENDFQLIVESDGYDHVIRQTMETVITPGFVCPEIRSNTLKPLKDNSLLLQFDHWSFDCIGGLGTCKCLMAKADYYNVVIGNDRTDFCVARRADYVIAKKDDLLERQCRIWHFEKKTQYDTFSDFSEVIEILDRLSRRLASGSL
jgi:2,3-diketo-5-methylthio-1-phosphopentane phosphatase